MSACFRSRKRWEYFSGGWAGACAGDVINDICRSFTPSPPNPTPFPPLLLYSIDSFLCRPTFGTSTGRACKQYQTSSSPRRFAAWVLASQSSIFCTRHTCPSYVLPVHAHASQARPGHTEGVPLSAESDQLRVSWCHCNDLRGWCILRHPPVSQREADNIATMELHWGSTFLCKH